MKDVSSTKHESSAKPVIYQENSSYTALQPEVTAMIDHTKKGWPVWAYELLQGAIDYNDSKQGPPEIYLTARDGQKYTLQEYCKMYETDENHVADNIGKISFENHIGKTGLRPANLVLTNHQAGKDEKTLGTHGRGTKVAATAILAGGYTEANGGITVKSYAEGIGSWRGEFIMKDFPNDNTQPQRLAIEYQVTSSGKEYNETAIEIHNPSYELALSLSKLPDCFLYADTSYPGNTFTGKKDALNPTFVKYSSGETWEVVEKKVYGTCDYIYVDGLRVKIPGKQKTALPYHVSKPVPGSIRRSNDSLSATSPLDEDFVTNMMLKVFTSEHYLKVLQEITNASHEERSHIVENSRCYLRGNVSLRENKIQLERLKTAYFFFKENNLKIARDANVVITSRDGNPNDPDINGTVLVGLGDFFLKNLPLVDPNTRLLSDIKQEQLENERKKNPSKALLEQLQHDATERLTLKIINEDSGRRAAVQALAILLKNGATFQGDENNKCFTVTMPDVYMVSPKSLSEIDPRIHELLTILAATNNLQAVTSLFFKSQETEPSKIACGTVKTDSDRVVMISSVIQTKDTSDSNTELENGTLIKVYSENKEVLTRLIHAMKEFLPTVLTDGKFDFTKWKRSPYYTPIEQRLLESELAAERIEDVLKKQRMLATLLQDFGLNVDENLAILDWDEDTQMVQYDSSYLHDRRRNWSGYCEQYKPGTIFGLSRVGVKKGKSIMEMKPTKEDLREMIDFMLLDCDATKYLILTHSGAKGSNYALQGSLPRETHIQGLPKLVYNKQLRNGTMILPVPHGHRPVGWYHKDDHLNPLVLLAKENGQPYYTLTISQDLPRGIAILYEKDNLASIDSPSQNQKQQLCSLKNLRPYWKNLISFIRDSNLDDSQKLGYLLIAWVQNFSYTRQDRQIQQYRGLTGSELVEKTINLAAGDCGYCSLGFRAILSLAGIPNEEVIAQLSEVGAYGSDTLHSMASVYVDNRWVLVEPQGTISESIDIKPVRDRQLEKKIEDLLDKIPHSRFNDHSQDFNISPDLLSGLGRNIQKKQDHGERKMFTKKEIFAVFGTAMATASLSLGVFLAGPSQESIPNTERQTSLPQTARDVISGSMVLLTGGVLGYTLSRTKRK